MALDPYQPRSSCSSIAPLLGLIAGSSGRRASGGPTCSGATACRSGQKDPQFGMDVSFFAFDLPWWRFVLGFAFADGRPVA